MGFPFWDAFYEMHADGCSSDALLAECRRELSGLALLRADAVAVISWQARGGRWRLANRLRRGYGHALPAALRQGQSPTSSFD